VSEGFMKADLILINGNFITMNPSDPHAQAVAVAKGKIVDVGTNARIKQWLGERTKVLDLKRKTAVPGLIDSHAHLISLGHPFPWLDLRYVSSIKEIQNRLKAKVDETGKEKWILGRGWDQDRLKERRYPTRWDLDKVSPDNPVLLNRVCGHVGVANSRALQIAKIDRKTADSSHRFIDRDRKTGEPTGLLREKVLHLLSNLLQPSEEDQLKACRKACSEAVKAGLTSVTCITYEPREISALKELRSRGQLPLRIYAMIPVECFEGFKGKQLIDPFLQLRCLKIFADGSLGARTAALQEPYADELSTKGILHYRSAQLRDLLKQADEADFQVAVHVIGDEAVKQTLEAFQDGLGKERIMKHRHRVEHASVLSSLLIKKIRALGIIACVQPHFVISDFWIQQRLGSKRARWTYAFKSLIKHGVRLAASSDAPVEPLSPLIGIWAATTGHSSAEERLSVEEALKAYTIGAAYFSFEEQVKGSIEIGKYADFTVLSHDPFDVQLDDIKDIRVEMTVVGGKVVFQAEE